MERPFGSAFWNNSPRATWYVKRVQESGRSTLSLGLFNCKSNSGALAPPIGLNLKFTEDRTLIQRTDVRDVPELAGQVPAKDRMRHALRGCALTYAELAESLGANPDTVKKFANR